MIICHVSIARWCGAHCTADWFQSCHSKLACYMAEHYGESALAAAAEAFVTHLVENRYIGPDTPVSVGLTERNLRNIYSLVG